VTRMPRDFHCFFPNNCNCCPPNRRAYDALAAEVASVYAGPSYVRIGKLEDRICELEAALYGAAESLASFRPHIPAVHDFPATWTELDEVTLHDAQRLCGKYPQSETSGKPEKQGDL
jgi:hypothetical protein